jgi:hypothetical protein
MLMKKVKLHACNSLSEIKNVETAVTGRPKQDLHDDIK